MDENEIDDANDLADCPEIDDLEIEVIAVTDYNNAGCAGCFFAADFVIINRLYRLKTRFLAPNSLLKKNCEAVLIKPFIIC